MDNFIHDKSPKMAEDNSSTNQSSSFKAFWMSLQNLDMDNYGSWPLAVKTFVIAVIFLFIAIFAYAIPISAKLEEIKAAEAQQETLLNTYKQKESKARYLNEYKQQVKQMEQELNALLEQLPKDTRVSELVKGINMTGIASDIRFKDISIDPEIDQELFIEQPIRIAAVGDYHNFGAFISGLAALPRIITIHDFEVTNPQPSLDNLPELDLVVNTKTYRAKDITTNANNDNEAATDADNKEGE